MRGQFFNGSQNLNQDSFVGLNKKAPATTEAIRNIKMRVEIKKITPNFASALLDSNKANRKINKSQLDMLVRSMQSGKWRLTHQGIAIYTDGGLADGQHRLSAIVKSGVTCEMAIFYGVERDPDTVVAIDCGKSRSAVDSGRISGMGISNNTTTLAKGIEFGYKERMPKLTHSELIELCKKHKKIIDIINLAFPSNVKGVSIAPVKVAIGIAVDAGVSLDIARSFCKTLVTGEYSEDIMKNAVKLRNKLMASNFNGGGDRPIAYAMAMHAILSTNSGKLIARFRTN